MFDDINDNQRAILRKISRIAAKMRTCWDKDYLFDLYCEADDLWNENFPFQAQQLGDKWYVTKLFNDLSRELKNMHNVTINLFDCNVTMKNA